MVARIFCAIYDINMSDPDTKKPAPPRGFARRGGKEKTITTLGTEQNAPADRSLLQLGARLLSRQGRNNRTRQLCSCLRGIGLRVRQQSIGELNFILRHKESAVPLPFGPKSPKR